MVSSELLKMQQGLIQLINKEIKEIKQLIKKAKKDVKITGTNEEIKHIKSSTNSLKQGISVIEQELFKWRFKNATHDSVMKLNEIYQIIKEEKKGFIDTFPKS